jgi:hypothetical protein
MKFKKSFTFTLTITELDVCAVFILLIHGAIMFKSIDSSILDTAPVIAKEVKGPEVKIPVKIRWALSKRKRASRFSRYVKNMKAKDFSKEVLESDLGSELDDETLDQVKNLNLSKAQMDKIVKENEEVYKENVKELRDILQKNQKRFQVCYEKALLKDDLISGVSSLMLMVKDGSLINISSTFKGDGHKSAIGVLDNCLGKKSRSLKLSKIQGAHKIKFNLVFKS